MSRPEFIIRITEIINTAISVERFYNNLQNMSVDLYDCPLDIAYKNTLDLYLQVLLNNDNKKIDTFYWFLYEYMPNVLSKNMEMSIDTAQMWDKNEKPICYNIVTLAEYLYES